MLDVFSYPVSALMRFLHDLLGLAVEPTSGTAWAGAVVLLVVVVRLLLLRPAWHQLVAGRRAAALRPRLTALRAAQADDPAALRDAVRRLQAAEGPALAGLVPLLVQLPVLVGLYHLLAGFTLAGAASGNGVFTGDEVRSFAAATIAGVPLSAAVRTPAETLAQLAPGLDPLAVLVAVGLLLLLAAAAALLGARHALRQQPAAGPDDDPLTAALRSTGGALVWLAPVSVLAGGLLLPVPLALVLYWAVNGTWTTAQSWLLTRRLDQRRPEPA